MDTMASELLRGNRTRAKVNGGSLSTCVEFVEGDEVGDEVSVEVFVLVGIEMAVRLT